MYAVLSEADSQPVTEPQEGKGLLIDLPPEQRFYCVLSVLTEKISLLISGLNPSNVAPGGRVWQWIVYSMFQVLCKAIYVFTEQG